MTSDLPAGDPVVRTVSGDLPATDIGRTTMHEHVFIDAEAWFEEAGSMPSVADVDPDRPVGMDVLGMLRRNPALLHDNLRLDDEELAIRELEAYQRAGGDCVVDVTSVGLARNPLGLRRVAQRTGLRIVAGSSFYVGQSHPGYVADASVDELAAEIIRDVETGIDGTDVRAGIIGEVGTTSLTEGEVKVLRASAVAQQATGATISVHTHITHWLGESIVAILTAEHVPEHRIILGHLDEHLVDFGPGLAHLDYQHRLADLGVWLEYDGFGQEWYWDRIGAREPTDAERVTALATLIDEGYADQLLLGQDVWIKQCLQAYGGAGYGHLVRAVPALLGRAGVSPGDVDRMLIDNPRRALALGR